MSFDKTEYQLTLIQWQPFTADGVNQENGSEQRELYFIVKLEKRGKA